MLLPLHLPKKKKPRCNLTQIAGGQQCRKEKVDLCERKCAKTKGR